MRFAVEPFLQRRNQPRLSYARLAGEENQSPFPALCMSPAPEQQLELFIAAD